MNIDGEEKDYSINNSMAKIFINNKKADIYFGYNESDSYCETAYALLIGDMLNGYSVQKAYMNLDDKYKNEKHYENDGKTLKFAATLLYLPPSQNFSIVKTYTSEKSSLEVSREFSNSNQVTIKGITSMLDKGKSKITCGFRYGTDSDLSDPNNYQEVIITNPNDLIYFDGPQGNVLFSYVTTPNSGQTLYYRAFTDDGIYRNWAKEICHFDVPESTSNITEGLVAYYPFNGNANDESGNGNHGSVRGNVVLTYDRFGNANSAYRFPGEPFNYISVPDDETLHCSTFTLNAWVYTDADNYGSGYLINKGRDINNGSYRLLVRDVGATNLYGGSNDAYIDDNPETGVWHMVTGTVEGKTARYYLDGVLMDERTLSYPFVFNNSDPLTLGMHYYSGVPSYWAYPLLGIMDDVRIYNRVLSPSEIKTLYHEPNGQ
jgi:hypothetical protein